MHFVGTNLKFKINKIIKLHNIYVLIHSTKINYYNYYNVIVTTYHIVIIKI